MDIDISGILKMLDPIQTAVNRLGECGKPDGDYCLSNRPDERNGWSGMNPSRMCGGCAAYWHLGSAVNELMDLRRREAIIAAG